MVNDKDFMKVVHFRTDNLQVQSNDVVNEDCNIKSFLRDIESKLCVIEKNQQAMLKLLQSSTKENSKDLPNNIEVLRRNDLSVMRKTSLTGKRESTGMCANISSSDDEEIRKLYYTDELPETHNICQITKR